MTPKPAMAELIALAKANQLQSLKANEAQPDFRAERALAAAITERFGYEREVISRSTDEVVAALEARGIPTTVPCRVVGS